MIGASTAFFLAREGLDVALLERDDLASRASGAAAGMLRPMGENRDRGPFFQFGLRSLELYAELAAELRERSGIDPELEISGALDLALDEAEARDLRAKAAGLTDYDVEWLDPAAARLAAPQVTPDLLGALWSPREGHVRSPLAARAFAGAAASLGATVETGVAATGLVREGDAVTGVRTATGERSAGHVVLCAGAWTAGCGSWLGPAWSLPIEPVRGQILALDAPQPPLRPMVVGAGCYLVPKRDGSVVVGATQERVGFDCRVTAEGLAELLAAAPRAVPALARSTFRYAWGGLRPATPDQLPLVGPLPGLRGLLIATGHYRNGVLLAPVTGQLLTDAVTGKGWPDEAAAFAPARFPVESPAAG